MRSSNKAILSLNFISLYQDFHIPSYTTSLDQMNAVRLLLALEYTGCSNVSDKRPQGERKLYRGNTKSGKKYTLSVDIISDPPTSPPYPSLA